MLIVYIILSVISSIENCKINGYESGECVLFSSVKNQMTFCADVIQGEQICISKQLKNFEEISVGEKDNQLEKIFLKNLSIKIQKEYEQQNYSTMYVLQDKNCRNNYKTFLCNWNFPTCQDGSTQDLCQKICFNWTGSCGFQNDICQTKFSNQKRGLILCGQFY